MVPLDFNYITFKKKSDLKTKLGQYYTARFFFIAKVFLFYYRLRRVVEGHIHPGKKKPFGCIRALSY